MSIKIIRKRKKVEHITYTLAFDWEGEEHWGFVFDCDAEGNVDVDKLPEAARKNYEKCVANSHDKPIVNKGLTRNVHRETLPKIGICDNCGREVTLDSFTNTCRCGIDYNMGGNQLAPREQWGHETGESWHDIIDL